MRPKSSPTQPEPRVAKLVNLGSLCIDTVYSVPNLAGAGETVASLDCRVFPGGKGLNQSIAAAHGGCLVHHLGAVGEDGDVLLDALRNANVDVSGVARCAGQSGNAVIQVDTAGQNAIVITGGANRALDQAVIDDAIDRLEDGDWLLLQNEINDVAAVIRQARKADAHIALNLAPADERISDYPLELLDLLVVNEIEAMAAADSTAVDTAFTALRQRLPETAIVLTEGSSGLRFADPVHSQSGNLASFAVTPVDETAAGDAFVGYLLAGLVAGADLHTVLPVASAAGALAVTVEGAATSIPEREAVMRLVGEQAL